MNVFQLYGRLSIAVRKLGLSVDTMVWSTLAMTVILMLGVLSFLGSLAFKAGYSQAEAPGSNKGGTEGTGDRPTHDEACDAIAAEFLLTPRERDVLLLFSQGNSYKKTAELLFLSLSTVQSHTRGLYQKTGLHSQQEVIDFVKSRM